MSAFQHAVSRRAIGDMRIALLVTLAVFCSFLVAVMAAADSPSGVMRLSATDVQRSGRAMDLVRHAVGGTTLVGVQPADAATALLAVSRDGRTAAIADRIGEASGTLTLAMDDGAQLRVPFPGLLAATFASDGAWLAVLDGRGALWKLDAGSGSREPLLDGPFIGAPVFAADSSLLLLSVPSVEAPYQSRLVRLAIGSRVPDPISDEDLVYAVFPLDDGDLAVVAHRAEGTVVRELAGGTERRLVVLGPGAVNVAVSPDGRVAFERGGDGIFVLDAPGSAPRSIGVGSRPCFGPDGKELLIERQGQRVAVAMDGTVLAALDELAVFVGSAGCLP